MHSTVLRVALVLGEILRKYIATDSHSDFSVMIQIQWRRLALMYRLDRHLPQQIFAASLQNFQNDLLPLNLDRFEEIFGPDDYVSDRSRRLSQIEQAAIDCPD